MYGWDTTPSAEHICTVLQDLVKPRSVLDVGCGLGTFLAEFISLGVNDVVGVDGPASLAVFQPPGHLFHAADITMPLDLRRRFDLALCFEVGEHLTENAAAQLIESLTAHAPVVAFSAAHPGQGGQGHVNERWPVHWQRRFHQHGYVAMDLLRGRLCGTPAVADFYRTNAFIFAEAHRAGELLASADETETPDAYMRCYAGAIDQDLKHQPWRALVATLASKALGRNRE
jgi:SAM-dependent methyltransferase